ncbi:MAG: UDP-N-acetylglucosamine--N-acetylmuramyl-(pentapeptide) pyrophosphoryl-undecaprenol N-acetylglucosamine transferase [Clostridia bacterium]|nr:UDP-N-acetylglucosamine--N-acetylmuramyl-(pentapeptide) pyrophosphoryl-undecaprenol N-acetylglucosamine transferase [Clostridia bacterium]
MKIFFSCGGTAGHINPALAIAAGIRKRKPEAEIVFGGSRGGMEEGLVAAAGYEIVTIPMQGLSRKLTPKGIWHNAKTLCYLMRAVPSAKQILLEHAPDAVIGTGGFACFPFLYAAHSLGIPTMLHESNALVGKTTKFLQNRCDRILIGFDAARKCFKDPAKPVWTGNPITADMTLRRDAVREKYGLPKDMPVVLSAWGSLGAREMNRHMADYFACAEKDDTFLHIHATGKFGKKWFPELLHERGIDRPNTDVREYIENLAEVMQGADLILCRAGAMTMTEVCCAGLPAIIVPSPNVSENHQEENARALEAQGAAEVILEADCSGALLYARVRELLDSPDVRARMRSAGHGMAVWDAEERIWKELCDLLREKSEKVAD